MLFSFKYFDAKHEKFGARHAREGYLAQFLSRLQCICRDFSCRDFEKRSDHTLRNHRIEFSKTSEEAGFAGIAEELWREAAWQFSITKSEHGRVHGFIAGNIFFVVWIDPNHALYPGS